MGLAFDRGHQPTHRRPLPLIAFVVLARSKDLNPGTDAADHWSMFWTDWGMQLYFYSAEQENPSLRIGEV
jgi:hypothetical protein